MPELLEFAEVVSAIAIVIKPIDTVISRHAIENQVTDNSGKYPRISSKSQRELRKIITESMDFLYGNQCGGKYRHKWVWNISNCVLVLPQRRHMPELVDILSSPGIEYRRVIVPCVCCAGHPFPPDPNCHYCLGSGKIMYGIADVEVQ